MTRNRVKGTFVSRGGKMSHRGHRAGLLLATSAIALASNAAASETIIYSYDSLGRLVRVDRSGTVNSGVNSGYCYDSADNRTLVTVNQFGPLQCPVSAPPSSPPSPPISTGPTVAGGSFEVPEAGAHYLYRTTGGPASFTNNSGIAGNGSAWDFASAPEGDQVAFVQTVAAPAVVSLGVSGLTPGARYTASFYLAKRPGFPANPVTVAFNGTALGTFTPGSTAFTVMTSQAFTAAADSGTLTFTGAAQSADTSTGLDHVTVAVATATTSPPPPAGDPPPSPPSSDPPPPPPSSDPPPQPPVSDPPPPPPSSDPPPPPTSPWTVDDPLQQKKPGPAVPGDDSPDPGGDSPLPPQAMAVLELDKASGGGMVFEPESWTGSGFRGAVVRLPSGAAELWPGPSGTRGGAA